ncbi:hypothetical protein BHM03_00017976 [Ensete ventricosum]|uniref:Uncharacterized protein n=1 Tax=Ensete ventricosum TaxID=4639 RepID=A0A445MF58_ENSVE|nr:hypothetical protein BHM03_00017976 [Ensete ventricosum]
MRDLCRVKARVPNEPYMAREIAELPKLIGDSPLKVSWASLTLQHKVCTGVYRGILSLPLTKEIYTIPSEVLVDNAAKNLVTLKDEIGPIVIIATKAQANEVTAKLDEAQRGEAEALEKVKALEEELQGMRGDLEAAQAKTRETEKFLSVARAL